MWPFDVDDRLRTRLRKAEARIDDLESSLTTLATQATAQATALEHRLDQVGERLHKVAGKVYGHEGANAASQRAENIMPTGRLDRDGKNRLLARLGYLPGRRPPPHQIDIEE